LPLKQPEAVELLVEHLSSDARGNAVETETFLRAVERLDLAATRLGELVEAVIDAKRGVREFEEAYAIADELAVRYCPWMTE
jgi:hypothetical protein